MRNMTEKTGETSGKPTKGAGQGSPKKGERFQCAKCSMGVEVTSDCRCDQPDMVHFQCCGQEMAKT